MANLLRSCNCHTLLSVINVFTCSLQYGRTEPKKSGKLQPVQEGRVIGPFKSDEDDEEMAQPIIINESEEADITLISETETAEVTTTSTGAKTKKPKKTAVSAANSKRDEMINKVKS